MNDLFDDKGRLLARGQDVMLAFCDFNEIPAPAVRPRDSATWAFSACAFYRSHRIAICVQRCAAIGTAGRQWSFPGYTVDRTPYGVVQHELGHHVDWIRG